MRLYQIHFWFRKGLDCVSLIIDFVLHLLSILLLVLVAILNSLYQLLSSKTLAITELYFQSWSQRMIIRKSFRLLLHSIFEGWWLFARRMTLQIIGWFFLCLLLCSSEAHIIPRLNSQFRFQFLLIIDEIQHMLGWHHFAKLGVCHLMIWNCLFALFVKI